MKLFKKNILSNNKGITIIFVALLAFVLFAFAALAVDVAYFYVVKNELQVAADAAALAGAARLDGTNTTAQTTARQEAWRFACNNQAGGSPVSLISTSANCTTYPANLNQGNNANGDIVIGNWNPNRPVNTRFDATGPFSANNPINAVKVVARRTNDAPIVNVRIGNNPVGVFFGRFLGWDWMNIGAEAIASMPPRAGQYFSICNDPSLCASCIYPTTCTTTSTPTLLPRILDTKESSPDGNKFSWTSLLISPPSTDEFKTSICGNLPFQEVCQQSIYNFPGESSATYKALESAMYNPNYDVSNKTIVAGIVTAWTIIVPVTTECPPDKPSTKAVWGYAKLRLTRACGSGGGSACSPTTYNAPSGVCGGGDKLIEIDQISCVSCADRNLFLGLRPVLVR